MSTSSTLLREAPEGQRERALVTANEVRVLKAQFMQQVRAGELLGSDVVMDPPWFLATSRVFEVLEALPGVSKIKTRYLNIRAAQHMPPVNMLAPLGELSPAQRRWLVNEIPALRKRGPYRADTDQSLTRR